MSMEELDSATLDNVSEDMSLAIWMMLMKI